MKQINEENINNSTEIFDEDINLKKISGTIVRNKKIIFISAFVSFVVSVICSYSIPKTWKGNFQIVLSNSNSSSSKSLLSNTGLPESLNVADAFINSDLATEVEKLRSPSVLMQVFDFYKKELNQKDKKVNFTFNKWLKKFDIKLTNKTSVLSIDFKDTNKDQILPVLKKVSEVYQDYSGRDRNKKINNSSIFLNDQIKKYKIKSLNSLKNAQNFSTDNDLIFEDYDTKNSNIQNLIPNQESTDITNPNINIEKRKVAAANKIKFIELQLKNIESNNLVKEIQYLSSTIPGLENVNKPYLEKLNKVENELLNLKQFYKDNDPAIKKLSYMKNSLLELIKSETIGFLKAQKITEQANFKAAQREDAVLVKFKELLRENKRNNNTLVALEEQLRQTNLEKARNEEPWELITNPTIFEYPIYPNKKRVAFLGTLLGTFIGTIFAFIKESKSKKIYNLDVLEQIFNYPKIAMINNLSEDNNNLVALEHSIKKFDKNDLISFVKVGDINKINFESLINKLSELMEERVFNPDANLRDIDNSNNVYLITSLGSVTKEEIEEIKNLFYISKTNIIGWVLLDKELIY